MINEAGIGLPLTPRMRIDTWMVRGDDSSHGPLGSGTRARLALPDLPDPIDYEQNGGFPTGKVLIIEDDPDTARFIEGSLRSIGFCEVVIQEHGDAGLERTRRARPGALRIHDAGVAGG